MKTKQTWCLHKMILITSNTTAVNQRYDYCVTWDMKTETIITHWWDKAAQVRSVWSCLSHRSWPAWRPPRLWVQRSEVLVWSQQKPAGVFESSAVPVKPPSVHTTDRLYIAAPASAGSDATAPAGSVCPYGTSESERPERPARGRERRTSYPVADAGKCCWLRCIPSLPVWASRHCGSERTIKCFDSNLLRHKEHFLKISSL